MPELALEEANFDYVCFGEGDFTLAQMVLTNPSFYFRRLKHGLKTGEFFYDIYYYLRFLLAGAKI